MKHIHLIICIAALLLAGCSSGRFCDCNRINDLSAMPDENGVTVNQWLCRQTENAESVKGMIYQADWKGNTDQLSPFGRKRLGNWTGLSGVRPNLYIETSGDPFLDSRRQAAVSGTLNQIGLAISPESIQVANVDDGLAGEEIPAITDRFLSELSGSGGAQPQSFGGFGGSSTANQSGGFF